jgi:hypothetical protein
MKSIKVYLVVVSCFLAVALLSGILVWYLYQDFTYVEKTEVPQGENIDPVPEEQPTEIPIVESPEPRVPTSTPVHTVITVESLTPTQREILSHFGIKGESITISDTQIECIKRVLGDERFNEIIGGSAPSPLEAIKVVACLRESS